MPNEGLIRLKGFFNTDQLLVTSPKAMAEILVTRAYEFSKPKPGAAFLTYIIGEGLVTSEGFHHKQQRKHSMPSFGFRQVKALYPLFWEKSLKMVELMDKQLTFPGGDEKRPWGVTDIEYWAPKATLDIIGVAGLGRDFNSLEHSGDKIVELYERLTSTSLDMRILMSLFLLLGPTKGSLLYPTAARRLRLIITELRSLCRQFVREKRAKLQGQEVEEVDTLALLIGSGAFSDDELVDQILTILIAG
jgi:cytochrome P450